MLKSRGTMKNPFQGGFPGLGKATDRAEVEFGENFPNPENAPETIPAEPETGVPEGAGDAADVAPRFNLDELPGSAPSVDPATELPTISMEVGPGYLPDQAGGDFAESNFPGDAGFDIFF
jgi:hypothetical protein